MALVRKQVFITKDQDAWLNKESTTRGLSEAELVRRALDREIERLKRVNAKPF